MYSHMLPFFLNQMLAMRSSVRLFTVSIICIVIDKRSIVQVLYNTPHYNMDFIMFGSQILHHGFGSAVAQW